jgi:hypothetical protein
MSNEIPGYSISRSTVTGTWITLSNFTPGVTAASLKAAYADSEYFSNSDSDETIRSGSLRDAYRKARSAAAY